MLNALYTVFLQQNKLGKIKCQKNHKEKKMQLQLLENIHV